MTREKDSAPILDCVCRGYDCNADDLLQVVVHNGLASLSDIVSARLETTASGTVTVPRRDDSRTRSSES
jgi:hypothetical protein